MILIKEEVGVENLGGDRVKGKRLLFIGCCSLAYSWQSIGISCYTDRGNPV